MYDRRMYRVARTVHDHEAKIGLNHLLSWYIHRENNCIFLRTTKLTKMYIAR